MTASGDLSRVETIWPHLFGARAGRVGAPPPPLGREVPGIGKVRASRIAATREEQRHIRGLSRQLNVVLPRRLR